MLICALAFIWRLGEPEAIIVDRKWVRACRLTVRWSALLYLPLYVSFVILIWRGWPTAILSFIGLISALITFATFERVRVLFL